MTTTINRSMRELYLPMRLKVYDLVSYWNQHCGGEDRSGYVDVFETSRSLHRQQGLVAKGASWTKTSYHMLTLAVDIWPLTSFGTWPTKEAFEAWPHWDKFGEIAEAFGFEWGGRWKKRKDLPHLQMTFGVEKDALARILYKDGPYAIWQHLDNILENRKNLNNLLEDK